MTSTIAKPNALLFGLGAIGSVYASVLAHSGAVNVSVVARSNYAALNDHGFKLDSQKFGQRSHVLERVFRDTKEAVDSGMTFDYVLCANKALLDATPSLADQLRPIMGPKTSIVLLQNGVGNEDPLHAAFPKSTIISAVVWTGAKALDPAADGTPTFAQFASEGLTIGVDYPANQDPAERAAQRADLDRLVEWLRAGGSEITPTDDIQSARWIKVIWNCAWNALTTVTRLRTNHYFGSSPGAEDFSVALMNEVVAVARAKGLDVPEDQAQTHLERCKAASGAGLPSSMMMDNEAGRPMEVEVILGTPMREGQRLGVPVPILTTLYTVVKALNWRNAHREEAAAPGL